jgi:hypothetical protein
LLGLERAVGGRPADVAAATKRVSVQERVEREMLKLLARDATAFGAYAERLTPDHFRTPKHRRAFEALVAGRGDVAAIVASTDDERLVGALSALTVEPLEGDPTEEYAAGVWARLQEFHLKRQSDDLRAELQKLNPVTDDRYDELFQRLVELDGELRRVRDHEIGRVLTS